MAGDPHTKRLFWFIFGASRGGVNRIRIIRSLLDQPKNTNRLALDLGLDYKAIQHHTRVLEKNNLLTHEGQKYNIVYFVSALLEVNMASFEEITEKLDKSK